MQVPQLLLHTLEDLGTEDFKQLKWYLSQKSLDKPIPKSRLEAASRPETVSRMIESYGEERAVYITIEILTMMSFCGPAGELKNTYEAGKTTATSSTSSAAVVPPVVAPPAAGSTISAQQGVVFAPNISNCPTASWNINICNK